MKYAFVNKNVLDLRSNPQFQSERVNQLLFGEPVAVSSIRKGYAKIRMIDNYTGWADCRFLTPMSFSGYKQVAKSGNAIVGQKQVQCFDSEKSLCEPYFIFYGTMLKVVEAGDDFSRIILPEHDSLYVKNRSLIPINGRNEVNINGWSLIKEAKKFVGVPYLWGGNSPFGFDCSGFVKLVFRRFGISLPRDTKDQIKCGRKIMREGIQKGDLVFFKRHVGIALDKNRIIHSSIGGSGVAVNSIDRSFPGYRCDLDASYNQARRIL